MPRPANPAVRSRLLAKGADLVQRHGFNATGVQDIALAASVPKGSFYSYFDSKDAFGTEIASEYWFEISNNYGKFLEDKNINPYRRICLHFEGLVDYHRDHGFAIGCLIGNLALEVSFSSEPMRRRLFGLFDEWTQLLADCIGDAQVRGEIASQDSASELAASLIDAFEGAVMRAKVERTDRALLRFQEQSLPRLLA